MTTDKRGFLQLDALFFNTPLVQIEDARMKSGVTADVMAWL